MSNREFQRKLAAQVFAGLPPGMAIVGRLLPKDAGAGEQGVPCRAYVSTDTQTVGQAQQRSTGNFQVTLFLEDATPVQGMVLVADGERYQLQKRLGQNLALSKWSAFIAPENADV